MNLNFNATNAELYAYYHCKQKRPLKINVQKKINTLPSSISSLYHSTSNLIENVPRQHHYRKSHKAKCTQVDAEYLCPFSSNDHRMRDGNSICDDQGHIHRYTEGSYCLARQSSPPPPVTAPLSHRKSTNVKNLLKAVGVVGVENINTIELLSSKSLTSNNSNSHLQQHGQVSATVVNVAQNCQQFRMTNKPHQYLRNKFWRVPSSQSSQPLTGTVPNIHSKLKVSSSTMTHILHNSGSHDMDSLFNEQERRNLTSKSMKKQQVGQSGNRNSQQNSVQQQSQQRHGQNDAEPFTNRKSDGDNIINPVQSAVMERRFYQAPHSVHSTKSTSSVACNDSSTTSISELGSRHHQNVADGAPCDQPIYRNNSNQMCKSSGTQSKTPNNTLNLLPSSVPRPESKFSLPSSSNSKTNNNHHTQMQRISNQEFNILDVADIDQKPNQTGKCISYPVECCQTSLFACNDAINAANLLECLQTSTSLLSTIVNQSKNQSETTVATLSSSSCSDSRSQKASFFSSVKNGYNFLLQKKTNSQSTTATESSSAAATTKSAKSRIDKRRCTDNVIQTFGQDLAENSDKSNGSQHPLGFKHNRHQQHKFQPGYLHSPSKTNDDAHLFNQKGSSTIRESVRSPIHLFSYFDLHNVKSSVAKNKNTTKPLLASPNNAILVNNSHDYNLNADYSYSPAVSLNEELNNNILHQSICKSQLQQNNQSKSIYIPANNTNKINDKILIKLHQKSSSGKLNTSRKIEQVTPDHLAVAATQHLRSPLSSTPTLLSTSKTTMHAAASSTSDDISIINTADSKKVSSRKVNTNDNSHSNKIFSATICNPHHPVSSSDNSSSQQQSYQNCCISAKHAQMLGNLVEKDIKQFRRSIESQQNELQRIQQACLNRDRRKTSDLCSQNSKVTNHSYNSDTARTAASRSLFQRNSTTGDDNNLQSVFAGLKHQKQKLEQKNQILEESLQSAHRSLDSLRHQLRTNEEEWNTQRNDFRNSLKVLEKELEQVIREKAQAQMMWAQVCDEKKKLEMSTEHQFMEYNSEINELRAKCKALEVGCSDLRENLQSERIKHQNESNEWLDFQRDLQTAVRVANDLKLEAEERAKNLELEISRLKRIDDALSDSLSMLQNSNTDLKSRCSVNDPRISAAVNATSPSKFLTAETSSSYINYDLAGRVPIKDMIKRLEASMKSSSPGPSVVNNSEYNPGTYSQSFGGKGDMGYCKMKIMQFDQRKQQIDKRVHKRHFSCKTVSEFAMDQEKQRKEIEFSLEEDKDQLQQSQRQSSSPSNHGTTTDDVKFITRSQSLNHGQRLHLKSPNSTHDRAISPSEQFKCGSTTSATSKQLAGLRNSVNMDFASCWPVQTHNKAEPHIDRQYNNLNNQQISDDKYNILSVLSMKYQLKGSRRNALLKWCRERTINYKDVCITNFSSSWTNGNALIALLHSFLPDQINYDQLSENNVEIKFRTAFSIAEQQGIKTTLDLEDILHSERPSWEPIMDYITEIFRRFGYHNMLPNVSSSSSSINSPQNVTTENAIVEDISSTNEDSSATSINNMFDQHPQQHQQTQQTIFKSSKKSCL